MNDDLHDMKFMYNVHVYVYRYIKENYFIFNSFLIYIAIKIKFNLI